MAVTSKATLQDVAREAQVSLATVDRVLNRRPGVRGDTAERVQAAIDRLGYRPDLSAARLARARHWTFDVILPSGPNSFMQRLEGALQATAAQMVRERVQLRLQRVDVFDGPCLARAIEACDGETDGLAVVALDHPEVREAVDGLAARGTPVVTLVSDIPSARRQHYVGIDNTAAGRTAANLLGRFLAGRRGKVGLIAGSLGLRDHVERFYGFQQVMAERFPALQLLPVAEARDDHRKVEAVAASLLRQEPDLVGLYSLGAGNRGAVRALEAAGSSIELVFIAHELTEASRRSLVQGTIDALINQDPAHEARSAARVLLALAEGEALVPSQERIRIEILLRDNLP